MRPRQLAALAAVGFGLWALAPAQAGRTWDSYVQQRCVVRAGILVPNVAARLTPPNPSLATPSPYALWLLSSESVEVPLPTGQSYTFYPPRPPGWEIINPIATPGIDKGYVDYTNFSGYSAYWTVDLSTADLPLLENFDLLLLPITDDLAGWVGANFAAASRALGLLERWVDEGGVLWIDNQRSAATAFNPDPFFLRPPVQFAAPNLSVAAVKEVVDPNHPLLSGRFVLSGDEVQLLGRQYAYNQSDAGLSPLDNILGGVNAPDNPNASVTIPQEVVGELYDSGGTKHRAPVIAAGRYGDGSLVITACAVAAGISDWYAALTAAAPIPQTDTELPQWALPDMKLAYNIIQWGTDWSGAHGRARQRGDYAAAMPGPPLMTWVDQQALAGSLAGAACVDRGLAFAGSSAGILGAWDAKPYRDRDLANTPALSGVVVGAPYVKSDDGATDYALGTSQDLLWKVTVPWQDPNDANPRSPEPARQVVGSPAVNMAYVSDPVNPGVRARPLVAVAVKTADNLDCSLQAYLADGTDAARMVANPAPLWSATLKRHDRADPQENNGLLSSGPVAVDEFFAVLTTDSGTLEAPNRDVHLNLYNASGPGGVANTYYEEPAVSLEMSRGGRAMSAANPPAAAMTEARDVVRDQVVPVQAAVLTGNSLPRPAPSAVGWLHVTPLMVRAAAPGWDQTWLVNPALGDVADDRATPGDDNNQAVMVLFPNSYGNPEVYSDERAGWVQVPPHVNNDPLQPLNYVRGVVGGQITITFTRWSMFAWGPCTDNKYPLGFGQIWIRYRDTQGNPRDLTDLGLSPAAPVALNGILGGAGARTNSVSGFVNEQGRASPCVFRDRIYVGTDAVNAYPSASSEGQVASYALGQAGSVNLNWRFIGDRYRAQDPAAATGYYFSSFSLTPAYAGDTLYAVSNYGFFRRASDGVTEPLSAGPAGALYALDVRASPELINPATGSPVFPSAIDPLAPRNDGKPIAAAPTGAVRATDVVIITTEQPHGLLASYTVRVSGVSSALGTDFNGDFVIATVPSATTFTYSQAGPADTGGGGVVYYQVFPPFSADPNQTVAPGRRGAAVWISTSLTDDSPRYAIPAVSAAQGNWRVDYRNGIVRLEAGAFGDLGCPVWSQVAGRYVAQRVRVRYFSGGAVQERVMEVTPLVKWMYLAPDGWEFVSPPVAANDMVMVVAYDHAGQRYLLLGFRSVPQDPTFGAYPLWSWSAAPEYVQVLGSGAPTTGAPCSLAASEGGLVWSADIGGLGGLVGLASGEAVIADNDRLLAADGGSGALTTQNTAWHMRPDPADGAAGIPIKDSYAERVLQPLQRPARVRSLPTGSLLVVDSGASSVMELDASFEAVGRSDCGAIWRYPNADTYADLGGWRTQPTDTSEAVRGAQLLAPADAQRYYYQASVQAAGWNDPEGVIREGETVSLEWVTTLIADTGKYRVLEVARPLLNGRYRPDVTDAITGNPLYVEVVREVAGSTLTDWPMAPSGVSRLQAAYTTVDRLAAANAYQFLSSSIMCGVSNHPPDPLGRDGYVRLVQIGPYSPDDDGKALALVRVNRVVPRPGEGINFFRPRISPWTPADAEQVPRDFLGIRQADLTVVPGANPGEFAYHAVIVDDVGVKVIDNNWNTTLTPTFEMRGPAPWLHDAASKLPGDYLATYEEEIAGGTVVGQATQPLLTRATNQMVLGLGQALQQWVAQFGDPRTTGSYPPLIVEPLSAGLPGLPQAQLTDLAYRREALRRRAWLNVGYYAQAAAGGGQTGAALFLPSYALRMRTGRYLVVNSYPQPIVSAGPLDAMAPTTSEVLQVNPYQAVGQRIVQSWDSALNTWHALSWEHFMVPDPARSEYPAVRGGVVSFAVPRVPSPGSPDDYTVIPGGAGALRQPRAVDVR